jgi:hypothetical protein
MNEHPNPLKKQESRSHIREGRDGWVLENRCVWRWTAQSGRGLLFIFRAFLPAKALTLMFTSLKMNRPVREYVDLALLDLMETGEPRELSQETAESQPQPQQPTELSQETPQRQPQRR